MFDAIKGYTPWTDSYLNDISASKITHPSGFVYPASTIPAGVFAASGLPQGVADLSADPAFSRAYESPFTRKIRASEWTAPSGGGFPAAIKDGVLFPSYSNDRVYEIPRNSTGGNDALFVAQQTHTFTSGDKPIHAVAKDPKTAYVLCSGNSPSVNPSIKTISLGQSGGTATTFLDLGSTYTAAYKIATNRQGSYLYVLAKRSGDGTWRRLLRVDTSTLAVSEFDLGSNVNNAVFDLCMSWHGTATAAATGYVIVAMYEHVVGAYCLVSVRECASDTYGGSFGSSSTYFYHESGGNYAGVCTFRGAIVASWKVTAGATYFGTYYPDPTNTTMRGIVEANMTFQPTTVSDLVAGTPPTGSSSTQNGLIPGSVSTDGRFCYVLGNGGAIAMYDPIAGTIKAIAPTNPSITMSTSNIYSQCGMAFSGKHMIGSFNKTSDGTGYLFTL
jgi:hypothetical protein